MSNNESPKFEIESILQNEAVLKKLATKIMDLISTKGSSGGGCESGFYETRQSGIIDAQKATWKSKLEEANIEFAESDIDRIARDYPLNPDEIDQVAIEIKTSGEARKPISMSMIVSTIQKVIADNEFMVRKGRIKAAFESPTPGYMCHPAFFSDCLACGPWSAGAFNFCKSCGPNNAQQFVQCEVCGPNNVQQKYIQCVPCSPNNAQQFACTVCGPTSRQQQFGCTACGPNKAYQFGCTFCGPGSSHLFSCTACGPNNSQQFACTVCGPTSPQQQFGCTACGPNNSQQFVCAVCGPNNISYGGCVPGAPNQPEGCGKVFSLPGGGCSGFFDPAPIDSIEDIQQQISLLRAQLEAIQAKLSRL